MFPCLTKPESQAVFHAAAVATLARLIVRNLCKLRSMLNWQGGRLGCKFLAIWQICITPLFDVIDACM